MTMSNYDILDDAEKLIEDGYATMMRGFYRLRKAGLIQDEYDRVGIIINILAQDRQHIRNAYSVKM